MRASGLKAKIGATARQAQWRLAYWRLRRPRRLPDFTLDQAAILEALKASPIPVAPWRVDADA